MPIIVQILYSSPLLNTHSQKKAALLNPMGPQFSHRDINSQQYFFTLPNTIDNNLFVHLVQLDTTLFDLQDLDHEDLANHKEGKRRLAESRAFKQETKKVGKSGLIQKRVDKESRIGRIGTCLEEPRMEAKGS